ncbi:MAG: hypothetical protein LAP87_01955 [Acidobacteriia bacterium]|nr:hypothetical protein [Terriglobia bacterium]
MDVERTMQFILEMQARHETAHAEYEAAHARNEAAHAKYEAAFAENEARSARMDRRIDRLARLGMRALEEQGNRINILIASQAELQQSLRELSEAQKVTETKMQAWFDSMRKGGNGGTTHEL